MSTIALPDPDAVRSRALSMLTIATVLGECGHGYEQLHDGRWQGPAADAACERTSLFAHDLTGAQNLLREAGDALLHHAAVLDEVVAHLVAIRRREQDPARTPPAGASSDQLATAAAAAQADALAVSMLRDAATSMLHASAARTAAVLISVAGRAPKVATFHPKAVGLDHFGQSVQRIPVVGGAGDLVRWVAADPSSLTRRLDEKVDARFGSRLDDALDMAGLSPGVGIPADIVHIALDAARGRWADAGIATVGIAPFWGDGVQAAWKARKLEQRLAGDADDTLGAWRAVRDARRAEAAERASRSLSEDLVDHLATKNVDRLDTAFALDGDRGIYEKAIAALNHAPQVPSLPPTATPLFGVLAAEHIQWQGHDDADPTDADRRPYRWHGTAQVHEGQRLVTYAFTLTRAGQVLRAPRPLRATPLPPQHGHYRRIPATDEPDRGYFPADVTRPRRADSVLTGGPGITWGAR